MDVRVLKFLRQVHLYLGIFIAPAVLFFAFTGALQTFSLHESSKGSSYRPAKWILVLAEVHKKQTMDVPAQKMLPAAAQPAAGQHKAKDSAPAPVKDPPAGTSLPLKVFFLLVCVGLFTSTFSGLYMSYKYSRNRVVIAALLVAGVVIPVALTVGHGH